MHENHKSVMDKLIPVSPPIPLARDKNTKAVITVYLEQQT